MYYVHPDETTLAALEPVIRLDQQLEVLAAQRLPIDEQHASNHVCQGLYREYREARHALAAVLEEPKGFFYANADDMRKYLAVWHTDWDSGLMHLLVRWARRRRGTGPGTYPEVVKPDFRMLGCGEVAFA